MMALQGSLQARDPITRKRRHLMRGANVTTPVLPDKEDPTKRNMKGELENRVTGRVAKQLRHLAANQQTRPLRKAELETREAEKTLGQGGMKGKVEELEGGTPLAGGVTLRKGESRATGAEKTGELTIGHQTETITSN